MARRRNKLAEWARRTKDELNGIGGLASLGGTALGAGGLTFLSGTAAILLSGGGAVIVVGTLGYAVYKAIPPAMRRAEDYVGQTILLDDLTLFDPPLMTLGIVGPSMAGKTTLRSRMAIEKSENVRTQNISAKVVSLQTTPQSYLAILDGGGERLAQQFSVAFSSDLLIFVVDHNASDHDKVTKQKRLDDTKEMINQVGLSLDEQHAITKKDIFFLINKKDLWEDGQDRGVIISYFEAISNEWRVANRAVRIRNRPFSNNSPDDLAVLMADLKEVASRRVVMP